MGNIMITYDYNCPNCRKPSTRRVSMAERKTQECFKCGELLVQDIVSPRVIGANTGARSTAYD